MDKPYREHRNSAESLVTAYEQTRDGFVALAFERNRCANTFIAAARSLKAYASKTHDPRSLPGIPEIRDALASSAGFSDQDVTKVGDDTVKEAIEQLISKFLEPAGGAFVEELVYRYLLTKGDALGGSMRNIGGAMAQHKLTRAIISALSLSNTAYQWRHNNTDAWARGKKDDAGIEMHVCALSWSIGEKKRTLVYNRLIPWIEKNVDMSLLDCAADELDKAIALPERFVAFGELKGGIDPAGADEHWKTAGSALARVRKAAREGGASPKIFFVGASIQKTMAREIWADLKKGVLSNSANLTDASQVTSLCNWLISL